MSDDQPKITVHYPMGEDLTRRYHAAMEDNLRKIFPDWEGLRQALSAATTKAVRAQQDAWITEQLTTTPTPPPDPWTSASDPGTILREVEQAYELIRDAPYLREPKFYGTPAQVERYRRWRHTVYVVEKPGSDLGWELLADQPGLAPWLAKLQREAIARHTAVTPPRFGGWSLP